MNEYREKYKIILQLLDDNPQLVSLVHQDLAKMLSRSERGRKSEYNSEQILRSLIVMFGRICIFAEYLHFFDRATIFQDVGNSKRSDAVP